MDPRIGPVHLPKAKDLTEALKANSVVTTVYHPMHFILLLVPEIGGMKLGKYPYSNHI
jgi:hypothetical protein